MMKPTARTRHFYIACLAARFAAFAFLVAYALCNPQGFSADLNAEIFHITPLTLVWLLLMLSMLLRFFPSKTESLGCQKELGHRQGEHSYRFFHRLSLPILKVHLSDRLRRGHEC